jgi:hypothetical protein
MEEDEKMPTDSYLTLNHSSRALVRHSEIDLASSPFRSKNSGSRGLRSGGDDIEPTSIRAKKLQFEFQVPTRMASDTGKRLRFADQHSVRSFHEKDAIASSYNGSSMKGMSEKGKPALKAGTSRFYSDKQNV